MLYEQTSDLPGALEEMEQASTLAGDGSVNAIASLGHAYAVAGQKDKAEKLQELEDRANHEHASGYQFALISLGLGDKDRALSALEQAFRDRSTLLIYLKMDPRFDELRSEPRFQYILRNIGLISQT